MAAGDLLPPPRHGPAGRCRAGRHARLERGAQPVVVLPTGGRLAVVDGTGVGAGDVVPGVAEALAAGVEVGGALPATAEAEGRGGSEGRTVAVGTGIAEPDGVDDGAVPSCSVQSVPSQVQVSPTTPPAVDVEPGASPPNSTTCPVPPSYARAKPERGPGVSAVVSCVHPVVGSVETHVPSAASRPTASPSAVSVTGATPKKGAAALDGVTWKDVHPLPVHAQSSAAGRMGQGAPLGQVMAGPPISAYRSGPRSTRRPGPGNQTRSPPDSGASLGSTATFWKELPSNTQVSVAGRRAQGSPTSAQFEQVTSEPVAEFVAPDPEVIGHITQEDTEHGTGQAMLAAPPAPCATGQTGQAITYDGLAPCAPAGTGHAVEVQPPSRGHAVGTGAVVAVAEGRATGESQGPPPTPMQTPAPLPVTPPALPVTPPVLPVTPPVLPASAVGLDTGTAEAEPSEEL